MNKLILLGHPAVRLSDIEDLLLGSGMQRAQPSKRDGLLPIDVVNILCEAHQCPALDEIASEEELQSVQAGPMWHSLALDLALANLHQPLWGWSDARNIYWFDYWRTLDPHATFLMVYGHPATTLQANSDTLADADLGMEVPRLLENWQAYNGAILRLYSRHPERCLLVNASRAKQQIQDYLDHLGEKLHGRAPPSLQASSAVATVKALSASTTSIGMSTDIVAAVSHIASPKENELLAYLQGTGDVDRYILSDLLEDFPQALQIYEELQSANTIAATDRGRCSIRPGSAWIQLTRQRHAFSEVLLGAHQKLKAQAEIEAALRQQLASVNKQLDEQKALASKQAAPTLPAPRLKELEEENDLLLVQLHQVQEELERYYLENQELKKSPAKTAVKPFGAAERVRQGLAYRLGAAMVEHGRSLTGWPSLPFALVGQVRAYRAHKKALGGKKLPPVSSYADAHEAERVKQHLSYRLGQTLLKHHKTPLGWLVLPFAIRRTLSDFRKSRA